MFDTFKRDATSNGRKRLQCNECRRVTIHTLEARCVGSWSEDNPYGHIDGWTNFSLYRCGACDEVCFLKEAYFSELYDHDHEGNIYLIPDEMQYPPPSSAEFAFDTDFTPSDLNELIEEMLYALSGSKLKLATVALRMVVEFIVKDKKCSGKDLQKKINDLHEKGHIDSTQLNLLQKIRIKGNAGAHERIAMTRSEMIAGIGIVNLLLEKLYNGPARHDDIVKKANNAFKE